jgi:Putative transposase
VKRRGLSRKERSLTDRVHDAALLLAPAGSKLDGASFFPCRTSTWSSPCRRRSTSSLCTHRGSSTICSSVPLVVPGGGFSVLGRQWRSTAKASFLLPFKVLSRRFRSLLTRFLREAWRDGTLALPERVVADGVALDLLLARATGTEWVVDCKPPFGGPQQVLAYLASYTHRIAISNSRILSFDGEHVCFRYRDYAHRNAEKLLTLDVDEFLRGFLLHVLPPRLVRIRYYGFLANRSRAQSIERARQLIGAPSFRPSPSSRPTSIVALNVVPAPCVSSALCQPNGHHQARRTRCDHLQFTASLGPTARSGGPVRSVPFHSGTTGRNRSDQLSALASPCLRHSDRSCAPMNAHANGRGSVQLGSIRNPDWLPSTRPRRVHR